MAALEVRIAFRFNAKRKPQVKRLAWILVLVSPLTEVSQAAEERYWITDLGEMFGPVNINEVEQIVGYQFSDRPADDYRAWLLHDGVRTLIDVPGAYDVFVWGLNNSGQAVGSWRDSIGRDHAYMWGGNTGWQDLHPEGAHSSSAWAINDLGQIVGNVFGRPVLWRGRNVIVDLGDLGGGGGNAMAINNLGQVVGISSLDPAAYHQHPFHWANGVMADLGMIGSGTQEYGVARDINDMGQIVGSCYAITRSAAGTAEDDMRHSFLWDDRNGMQDLGTGVLLDRINDAGQAVGRSLPRSNAEAYLFEQGRFINLNDLIGEASGWHLRRADDINERGHIVGYGTFKGQPHGYLLTPVPETTSMIALLIATVVVLLYSLGAGLLESLRSPRSTVIFTIRSSVSNPYQ